MGIIKLFDEATYPREILNIKKEFIKLFERDKNNFLAKKEDYIIDMIWERGLECPQIYFQLQKELEHHDIIGYHGTRLPNKESIEQMEIIFPDERYTHMMKRTIKNHGINKLVVDEIINGVIHERERHGAKDNNSRKREIYYFYNLECYMVYDKFLAFYGGELLEFSLKNKSISYKDVLKIGKPYIVEFYIPYVWLSELRRREVVNYLILEWMNEYFKWDSYKCYEGSLGKEIPYEKIIKIHEIDDKFIEIDRDTFENY